MEDNDRTLDDQSDRTVEMRVPGGATAKPSQPAQPQQPSKPQPVSRPAVPTPPRGADGHDKTVLQRVDPIFPDSTSLEERLPQAMSGQRPSPALDPIARGQVSQVAKWGLLVGVLFAVLWLPAALFSIRGATATPPAQSDAYYLMVVMAAAIFASVIATGLPRMLLPNIFGRWTDASEAFRDWLIVGVLNGLLYGGLIMLTKALRPEWIVDDLGSWVKFRLPILLISSAVAVIVGRALAIRQEAIVGGVAGALWQIPLQVLLVGGLVRFFEQIVRGITSYYIPPSFEVVEVVFGVLAVVSLAGALGIITWAASADASLMTLRRRGRSVDDGGPIDMTLTIIGGRESGKTVLLAAAFYEWSTKGIGNLRITPSEEAMQSDTRSDTSNLELVAKELYVDNQFPVGTVSTQNLPFDLWLDEEKIARFTFLDYPGGAIAGNVANRKFVEQFYERVEDTDGIILIADMSYVRRASKEQDWLDVRNAYREVMRRIVTRNGKRRVIPVALVLTKCDEWVDPNTGHVDMSALQAGLEDFEYDTLETEWRELNRTQGSGFVEFSMWVTSAITHSQPQFGRDGLPDYTKPFLIAPPPPPIKPTGCAAPLLWMCAKVMRWNFTIYSDIRRFVLGASPKVRKRADAILEMEQLAEERRGRA